ncbi:MAG: hypothetical protein ACLQMO_12615 [Acidobacteriaceae bacterium]
MRSTITVVALLTLCVVCQAVPASSPQQGQMQVWPSDPPADIPFAASKDLTGIAFTGRHVHYGNADTWFPTWGENGNLYSSWTDGKVNGISSSSAGAKATTGYATIVGDDPLHLTITNVGTYAASPLPYGGRYPAGGLVYNGVWYYGTYCLKQTPGTRLNWDILGPFVGFRYSTDYGKSWHANPHTPEHSLFDEPAKIGGPVKLGLPHFVDFGQNMEYSPDGNAYLVSQGATDADPKPRDANLSWITGDQIYLARVKPTIKNMNRRAAYEYFAGHDAHGHALWTHEFSKIQPLIDWNNHTGNVSMTYDAPLKKYLMAITDGGNTIGKYNTYTLESSQIAGPWRLVVYMRNFGEQAYFVNFPSKFISKDGRTLWLSYSANFTNGYLHTGYQSDPAGSGYWWTLQEVKLLGPATSNKR